MFYRIGVIGILILLSSCQENGKSVNLKPKEKNSPDFISDSLNFWNDVAPIVFENCTPCHHYDGAGPFSLTEFSDLKKRTKTIKLALSDGFMPPWPADTNYSHIKDVKSLSMLEKQIILAWIDQGAEEGVVPDIRPTPKKAVTGVSRLPDHIIRFPDSIQISGDNRDKFILAKIPFQLEKDTFLEAIGFKAGNKQLVHHVNGHLINYEGGKKTNQFEGEWNLNAEQVSSLEAYRLMKVANDDGSYPSLLVSAFNYLPGVEPIKYPEGMGGMRITKQGAFLLNTLHYGPSALDTTDLSEIHLFYASKKPERPLRELHLGTQGVSRIEPEFIIPADSVVAFTTRYSLKEDISALTVNPHMHLLGTYFEAFAHQKGDTIPLVRIPKWDFRWQYFYTFENPVKIPEGYEIVVIAEFDNTLDNPFNPFSPPKTMSESGEHMKTTDEMFQFFLNYVPYKDGDEKIDL